ncbi:unnamed protein product [Eruca vesicaria subsp. sativa]|uniref:Non-haem dioxygenase N-terminal domain-containing protein n=1 Tax=Eruca vesicaria subsp. sativa TaxID=29727 RepID=A0ABC8JXR8_ERUVS|nr:unnamed protein product [Eruca vesicaria subsp. sativa]
MDPPFNEMYNTLLCKQITNTENNVPEVPFSFSVTAVVEEVELPVIDVSLLMYGTEKERDKCKEDIARASREWGFFQVINHGISMDVLEKMRQEQIRVFREPFDKKSTSEKFSAGSYRWGTPSATCLRQLSWSEAFHVPMTDISDNKDFSTLSNGEICFGIGGFSIYVGRDTCREVRTKIKFLQRKLCEKHMLYKDESLSTMSETIRGVRFNATHRQ